MLLNTLEFFGYFIFDSRIINVSTTTNAMQEKIIIFETECIDMLTRNAPKRIISSSSDRNNAYRFCICFTLHIY